MTTTKTLLPLTSLRFFAALAIFYFHLATAADLPRLPVLANGVSFFFVLSGFILTYVYGDRSVGIARFYVARIARIWPVHALTFGLFLAVIPPGWQWATGGGSTIALTNLFLLQAWIPNQAYVLSFNSVAWSISAEMFFYAMFPALVAPQRFFWPYALIVITTVLLLVIGDLSPATNESTPWTLRWSYFVLQNPFMRLLEFATGVAAGRLYLGRHTNSKGGTVLEAVALAAAAFNLWLAAYVLPASGWLGAQSATWFAYAGSFPGFAAAIYAFALGKGRISQLLSWQPFVILGEISFSTYMLHLIVLRFFFGSHSPFGDLGPWVLVTLAIGVTYGGSYLMWLLWERPMRAVVMHAALRLMRPPRVQSAL